MKFEDQVAYKVWLDPDRGFAVLQRDHYNPEDPSKLWYRIHNLEFQDCGNGLWLPTKTEKTKCLYKGYEKDQWGIPSLLSTFTVSKLQINEDLPDELFDIKYPKGTMIIDRVGGVTYRVGMEVIDEMLDESLTDFINLQEKTNVKTISPLLSKKASTPNAVPIQTQIPDANLIKQSDPARASIGNRGIITTSQKSAWLQWLVAVLAVGCVFSAVAVIIQKKKTQRG